VRRGRKAEDIGASCAVQIDLLQVAPHDAAMLDNVLRNAITPRLHNLLGDHLQTRFSEVARKMAGSSSFADAGVDAAHSNDHTSHDSRLRKQHQTGCQVSTTPRPVEYDAR